MRLTTAEADAVDGCASCSKNGTPFARMSLSSRLCPTRYCATNRATMHYRMIGARTSNDDVTSIMITVTAAVILENPDSIAAEPMSAYVPLFAAGVTLEFKGVRRS